MLGYPHSVVKIAPAVARSDFEVPVVTAVVPDAHKVLVWMFRWSAHHSYPIFFL